jgi:hypothetical protein
MCQAQTCNAIINSWDCQRVLPFVSYPYIQTGVSDRMSVSSIDQFELNRLRGTEKGGPGTYVEK